jgi:hypothetical protein
VKRDASNNRFRFRFPGLGNETKPGSCRLISMAFAGERSAGACQVTVNFEPSNKLKETRMDFLRGSIENVLDDTVKILRRLRKKHWVIQ